VVVFVDVQIRSDDLEPLAHSDKRHEPELTGNIPLSIKSGT